MKRTVLAAFLLLAGGTDVNAQGKMAIPSLNVMPTAAPEADTDDPIDDRGTLELVVAHTKATWTWIVYSFGSMFASVTPPTPAAMVKGLQEEDQQLAFLSMMGDTGYKIIEIENGIGLPPYIALQFTRIRNLSDADIDYTDRELARWERRDSGMIAGAQRAVISTLVFVNQSDSFVVDSVRLRMLPLPQVKFSLAPTIVGLDRESNELMRAIRRLDQRVSGFKLEP